MGGEGAESEAIYGLYLIFKIILYKQFRKNYSNFLNCLILEDGFDRLSRNVGNKLSLYAA